MRISDWSSDVCSSDLKHGVLQLRQLGCAPAGQEFEEGQRVVGRLAITLGAHYDVKQLFFLELARSVAVGAQQPDVQTQRAYPCGQRLGDTLGIACLAAVDYGQLRSEEHTSELQSLMRISYAV